MIDFLAMQGRFVVTFSGEGFGCHIKQTAQEVLEFLVTWLSLASTEAEVGGSLNDESNWTFDQNGNPFEWQYPIGEMSHVSVTRVTER